MLMGELCVERQLTLRLLVPAAWRRPPSQPVQTIRSLETRFQSGPEVSLDSE